MESKILKKYLIGILVIAVLNFVGCYSLDSVTKKDLDEGNAQIDFSKEIYIQTKENFRYHFLPGDYRIISDTLYGQGLVKNSTGETNFKVSIAYDDIVSFQQDGIDALNTTGLVLSIIAAGVLIFGVIFMASLNDAFNPD
jgi:hypothetical protein